MEDLQKAAKIAFASEFAFYLKAHNYHWNVEGPLFPQMHELFGNIYEEVYGSLDDFAEKIRALDTPVPASFQSLNAISMISGEDMMQDAHTMLEQLLADSGKMSKLLKMVFDIATAEGEDGFANFLAERMDAHRKHSWMLRSTAK
jgi:starvation-inducible DNA-binding protein